MSNREFFRAKGSVVGAICAYSLMIGLCFQNVYSYGLAASWATIAWSGLVSFIIYTTLHRPSIEIFDEGIRIRNPFTTITVGWQDVDVIEAKYTAFLQLRDGQKIGIWCAQTPGRYHSRSIHPSEVKGLHLDGFIRPGESPRTDSGVATYLCRSRLLKFREGNLSGDVSGLLPYSQLREQTLISSLAGLLIVIIVLTIFHN